MINFGSPPPSPCGSCKPLVLRLSKLPSRFEETVCSLPVKEEGIN